MLSARSQFGHVLNYRARALARARQSAAVLWDLTESNPTRAGIDSDVQEFGRALGDPAIARYDPAPFGSLFARQAVAELWRVQGFSVSPAEVLLTASTSEAYSFLFKLLCDPGDEILVPRPSYPLFDSLAQLEGVRLRGYRLEYDGAWHIDFDSLCAGVTPRSRAVLAVSPNNPTGSFLKQEELSALCELGLPIICDEVFAAYARTRDPRRVRSILEADSVPVFALGGLSKYAALPQFKLAWTTFRGPEPFVTEAKSRLEHIADTFLSPSIPVQIALPALLGIGKARRAAVRERLLNNRAQLTECLVHSAITALHSEGGWYAVLRLPQCASEESWVVGLIERAGVIVDPGYFYDFAQEPYIIVSLLTPERVFTEGVRRLCDYVSAIST